VLSVWGCPKKAEVTATPEAQQAETQQETVTKPATSPETAQPDTQAAVSDESRERAASTAEALKPVY
jgi:hypothetical protein